MPVGGIKLHSPGSAATSFKNELRGFADITTTLAGYLGPPGFGLLAAFRLARNHPEAVLWIGLVLLAMFLLLARNLRAAVAALVLVAIVVGVLRAERRSLRSQGVKDTSSDAYQLRKATWIPAGIWVFGFVVGSVAGLLYGASLLLSV